MNELNINDLPEEMLIKVFRLLNAANLKTATLTCKLWNSLIESACQWSLNLWLEYDEDTNMDESWRNALQKGSDAEKIRRDAEQKMNFILTTNRKFETIKIFGGRLRKGGQLLQMFRKHGCHVSSLFVCRVHIDHLISFNELLNVTPNLKYVDIRMQTLHDASDVPDHVLPDLKKLTNLRMHVDDYRFMQCFRKAKIKTIKIVAPRDLEYRSAVAPFISSQDMLTSLTAEVNSPSVLAQMGKLDVPILFRLTRLAISDRGCRNPTHDHNLLKFVESQTTSLTEMEIGDGIPSSVYECVFTSMTKLNTLGVVPNHVPRDNEFYERLPENGSVCTMKILDAGSESACDVQFFSKFLEKLPNIRNIFLSPNGCWSKNILAVAARNLSKLEFLYMHFLNERSIDYIGRVNFFNLKTLYIRFLDVKIDWNEFTEIHSRLVELTIEAMSIKAFLTSDDIDQITTNVDLQNLKLGVGFKADNRFFEIIKMKCPNLKVLDLHKSCVSHGINYNKRNNLLRLCDESDCSTYSQMLT